MFRPGETLTELARKQQLAGAMIDRLAGFMDAEAKPILRISRRHHGNVKSSVITRCLLGEAERASSRQRYRVWGR